MAGRTILPASGMLASEKELVAIVSQELAVGINAAVTGWMADIEDVLDAPMSDSAKLSRIYSIVSLCKSSPLEESVPQPGMNRCRLQRV